jgi:hypothetical protein
VTTQPAGQAATDRATSDPPPLVPTATAAAGPAEGVTAREITEFLGHLTELHLTEFRAGAHRDDPTRRAAFLARKADLFTRIATQHPRTPADPPPSTAPPATTPEGRTP